MRANRYGSFDLPYVGPLGGYKDEVGVFSATARRSGRRSTRGFVGCPTPIPPWSGEAGQGCTGEYKDVARLLWQDPEKLRQTYAGRG